MPNFSSSSQLVRGCRGGCGIRGGGCSAPAAVRVGAQAPRWVGGGCTSLSEAPMSLSYVPQVTNATDIVFEVGDEQQLNSWTAEIRECARRG